MNTKSLLSFAIVIALLCLIGFGYFKHEQSSTATVKSISSEEVHNKGDVEKIIKEYISNNPEVIEEAMRNLYAKKMKEETERSAAAIKNKANELETDPLSPKAGSQTPKVKIVEFFDYNCGYCKHMLATKTKILDELKDVQIIFKELPILGESSKLAAKSAIAVNMVDATKYFQYHSELLALQGEITPQILEDLAKKVGVDVEKYKTTLADPQVEKHIDDNLKLASEIGVRGTPAYIVGGEFVPGAISFEDIKQYVEKAK